MDIIKQLRPYRELGFDLIPLRMQSKAPLRAGWATLPYEGDEAINRYVLEGYNIGVRLRPTDLVVDVDPRAFAIGENGWEKLQEDFGIDAAIYPVVGTGGGGLHVLMSKPADIPVCGTLTDYPGVDFKSHGTQIVAAGSVHPGGGQYDWRQTATIIPAAPDKLLAAIQRPSGQATQAGDADYEPHEVAEMLVGLEAIDFREYDKWMSLLFACHHASRGRAREEFVAWCQGDDKYAGHAWNIRKHWDSARVDRPGGVTYRTLHKYLEDAGKGRLIIRRSAAQDFVGVLPEMKRINAQLPEAEQLTPIEVLSQRYWYLHGSRDRIFYWEDDDELRAVPHFVDPASFKLRYGNVFLKLSDTKRQSLGDAWLKSPQRRDCTGLVFEPDGREVEGKLNLWTGWACEPASGNWGELRWLIHNVLCDADHRISEYVLNWMAYLVQKPTHIPEVAIAFHGDKGTGKSTLGRALCRLAGRHGRHITSPMHLTGRFNAHLRDCLFLFADEAIHPTERHDQSILKGLISEPVIQIEAKGVDTIQAKNRIHVMLASNDEWFVPASQAERRFCVSRVNNMVRQNSEFFTKLHEQLDWGGLPAMLFDLLQRDIAGWRPSANVPATPALTEQQLLGGGLVQHWWVEKLDSEIFGVQLVSESEDWHKGKINVFRDDLVSDLQRYVDMRGRKVMRGRSLTQDINRVLSRLCPDMKFGFTLKVPSHRIDVPTISDRGTAKAYEFPKFDTCQRLFKKALGLDPRSLLPEGHDQ